MNECWRRPSENLRGKDLAAFTIASFMRAQHCSSPAALDCRVMSEADLVYLNRPRAIKYWLENEWLCRRTGGLALTPDGIVKVERRLSGSAGAQSVSESRVIYWFHYIIKPVSL